MYDFIFKDYSQSRKGGAVVAGKKFLKALRRSGIETRDFSYTIGNSNWFGIITTYTNKSKGVIWNISTDSLTKFFIFIFVHTLLKKKVCIRFFGGDQKSSFLNSRIIRTIFRLLNYFGALMLIETEENFQFFKNLEFKTIHFPNFIDSDSICTNNSIRKLKRKLIFVGLIHEEKGVNLILEFLVRNPSYSCDFYGPLGNDFNLKTEFEEIWSRSYKGFIENSELMKKFSDYSLLILPSYKEGYPSIVLECLCHEMPMVLSKLPSLKEMVTNSAKFINHDVESLSQAIFSINQAELNYMTQSCINERQKFMEFNVIENFIRQF